MQPPADFAHYPDPVEGTETGYDPKPGTNPVLRGLPLAAAAAL